MWRGSLLPLDREAVPISAAAIRQIKLIDWFTTAARPSGSKLPRHNGPRCAMVVKTRPIE
ncbi:hypothetical protein C1Y08_16815 [Pseudomonas sp. FW306-02-F02-AA]|nr:hypothetical protein C1Y07_12330 [Pseudomonas sp. FW306-02-F02-AB]PMZ09148.1 hypothetical protein C1Y06_16065 [Pseudomonas sp. FW306-02-H06C]PMZ14861.1 hypothetical protein C1Y08_16815 [Pseudomonas sp. FW306-02-F02-AA]PMZ21411.1 hypothetical protein C1Y09_13220 [Pseudomonas sp. FW306-02-F08-AA]PMZ26444.1 hypothetical protein C1Y05_18685 [Pseudomonas sp. FW306-02-F04-BA]PMZ33933.1 hypothetical protein C1X99_14205 [Pseudomonas sp. FW306-02-H06B]PMZ39248.1 hypothetical protein C1Y00_18085 [Ps